MINIEFMAFCVSMITKIIGMYSKGGTNHGSGVG
jgi:hypothetical protein